MINKYKSLFWTYFVPVLFGIIFWFNQARYGFNPTDDGFVLSQSWRILHGQTPHVDFTSPRPLGSALIHLPEVLAPIGMIALSRLVVVLQFLWIAIATITYFFDEKYNLKNFQIATLSIIAFLINVNTWPIMPWYTVDGIFIGITSLWIANHNYRNKNLEKYKWVFVWLFAGLAPLIKQGFLLVPLLLMLNLIIKKHNQVWKSFPIMFLPLISYLIWTRNVEGGLKNNLYSGTLYELTRPFFQLKGVFETNIGLLTILTLVLALVIRLNLKHTTSIKIIFSWVLILMSIIQVIIRDDFWLSANWDWLIFIVFVIISLNFVNNKVDFAKVISIMGLGFASSMSWGVPGPGLIAGSMFAISLVLFVTQFRNEKIREHYGNLNISILVTLILIFSTSHYMRERNVYYESQRNTLNFQSDEPQLKFIKMSEQSAEFVDSIRFCLNKFPTKYFTLIPDGAAIYPIMGLNNPFPTDWWLSQERIITHDQRVQSIIENLNNTKSWLLLYQSYEASLLSTLPKNQINKAGEKKVYVPIDLNIEQKMSGEKIQCNSFTGVYKN